MGNGVQGIQEEHLTQSANSQQQTEENESQATPLNDVEKWERKSQEGCKVQVQELDEEIQLTRGVHSQQQTEEKQWWNRLSKCQKSFIVTVSILILLSCTYLLNLQKDSRVITVEEVEDKRYTIKSYVEEPKQIEEVNVEAQEIKSNNNNNDVNKNVLAVPKVEHRFSGPTTPRQAAVVEAFKHAWKGYKKFAWGHDNLKPISEGFTEWFGLGLTIVDSLDTIFIMGLDEEYDEARNWVDKHLNFDVNRDVNLFEVTIRVLGGLLSIYHFSKDDMFLKKATELADRLLPCFDSESGIPYSDINLFTRKPHAPKWSPDSSTSEVTTIQLEFRDLSRVTGDPKYENAVERVSKIIHKLDKKDGLVPIFINANTGQFRTYATITVGARGDSYYEYLLKQWVQTGKTIDYLKADYLESIAGMETHLARRTEPNRYLFIGELLGGGKDFKPKMDHLTCYLPGTLALGVHNGLPKKHWQLAEDLLDTCYQTYATQPTFLAPEITYFNMQTGNSKDMYVKSNDAHNLLRPEFVESLWYMYQLTGNTTYQDWGWKIFQGFEKYTKVVNGYTSIGNVRNEASVRPQDKMESFFLSETLKYLYLLFSDDPKLLNLDKYVVNSEAHPLPIYSN
ncbi:endoplasmic reticulum mannosyl-oligosaccharide 1,2-alpha-mannosidase isoform X2 [Diabrotica virgifera virgifera]|uniref:alpha-1,2-Mannosidase n=1 Tax=Diabrotica virgifera virgifera TaxID=50390 RepID=A0ABM5KP24_DIAVI|nr:endoplasmic reticulum mannosyl-oligosaccharide 1,2-alpha-mannosidase isoform X2 [Diabrotica virgifera virgifera]